MELLTKWKVPSTAWTVPAETIFRLIAAQKEKDAARRLLEEQEATAKATREASALAMAFVATELGIPPSNPAGADVDSDLQSPDYEGPLAPSIPVPTAPPQAVPLPDRPAGASTDLVPTPPTAAKSQPPRTSPPKEKKTRETKQRKSDRLQATTEPGMIPVSLSVPSSLSRSPSPLPQKEIARPERPLPAEPPKKRRRLSCPLTPACARNLAVPLGGLCDAAALRRCLAAPPGGR